MQWVPLKQWNWDCYFQKFLCTLCSLWPQEHIVLRFNSVLPKFAISSCPLFVPAITLVILAYPDLLIYVWSYKLKGKSLKLYLKICVFYAQNHCTWMTLLFCQNSHFLFKNHLPWNTSSFGLDARQNVSPIFFGHRLSSWTPLSPDCGLLVLTQVIVFCWISKAIKVCAHGVCICRLV